MKHTKKRRFHFNRTYRNYLLTYLVVLLVPLLIMIYGYIYSSKAIGEETKSYHVNLLRQTRQAYDQVFSLVKAELQVLVADQQVERLMRKENWSAREFQEVISLQQNLKNIRISNPRCDNIGVYFYQNKSLVTNYRRYPNQLMFLYTDGLEVTEEEFLAGIDRNQLEGYFLIGTTPENLRIIFYRNVYGVSFREVYATAMISIPWSAIREAADNISLSRQGGLFLLDEGGNLIGNSNPNVDISGIRYDSLEDEGLVPMKLQSLDYVVSSLKSTEIAVKYVIYTPKKIFYAKVHYLYYAILAEVVLCLLIGVALAVYFAKATFNPIQEMLALVEGKRQALGGSKEAVTYEKVELALQKLLREKGTMEQRLKQSEDYMRQGILSGAMKGWIKNEERLELCFSLIEQRWKGSNYRIILLRLDHPERCKLFSGQPQQDWPEIWRLVLFSIQNVLEELLLAEEQGVFVEIEDMAACIYPISSEEQDIGLELRIAECVAFYKEAFELVSYAAVSGLHQGAEELSLAYEEAYEVIAHKDFWGNEVPDVLLYDQEMLSEQSIGRQRVMETEKKLLNCLSAKDYQTAYELLDELMEQGMKKDIRYLSYNQCSASGIVSMLIGMFEELSGEWEDSYYQNAIAPERLLKARSVAALREEIHRIFTEVSSYYESKSRKEQPDWMEDVQRYLKENYADTNLNISTIAETFGMSLSYMGRTFRRYTGQGMLDYIHILRLNRCKELLDEGKTVKDAAEATGYLDSKAMIRAFKRYEGITPGQYKRKENKLGTPEDGGRKF